MHTNAKRLFSLLLAALLAASLCACGQQSFDRTEGIEPAAAVTDESGETTLYSDSYYVDTGYRISGYCNRYFSLCGEVVSFPLGEGTILQFLNLDDVKGQPYPVGRVWEDEGLRFMMRSFCALPELGLSSLSARTIDVEYRSDIDFAREKDGLQAGETRVQEYMRALLGITAVPYEDGWLIDRGECTYFSNLSASQSTTHYMCYLTAEPVA